MNARVHGKSTYSLLKQATRDTVRSAGGLEAAASYPEMRCQKSSLGNWQNPGMEEAFMPIDRAVDLMALTGDHSILSAMCHVMGGAFVRIDEGHDAHDWSGLLARFGRESSDVFAALGAALKDGTVDEGEAKQLLRELEEAHRATTALMNKAAAIIDRPKLKVAQ